METTTQKLIKGGKIICQRCKKEITEPAFILLRGEIINRAGSAMVYTCPEQQFNYAQGIILCDQCWVETLKDHETPMYDMDEVVKKYKEREKEAKKEG